MNQSQKKYVIIGVLCALVLALAVGYAAFNAVLNIKGTTSINSNWDVKITGIERTAYKGATDAEGSPGYDNTNGLSATFNTSFTTPGDYATYKITITNNGSMDAVLKNIKMPANTNNDIIFYLNKNQNNEDMAGALKQNDTLFKSGGTGNVGYVYVTVLYRDYEGQNTAETKTANMTIEFDFEQADGAVIPTPQLTTVYAYHTDTKTIGTSVLTEVDYVTDYTQISGYSESTRPMFLKYDIDEEGVIQNAYACLKFSFIDEPICLQGAKNFSEDNTLFNSHRATIKGLQTIFAANSGSCTLTAGEAYCSTHDFYITSFGGDVGANNSDGGCGVAADVGAFCNV